MEVTENYDGSNGWKYPSFQCSNVVSRNVAYAQGQFIYLCHFLALVVFTIESRETGRWAQRCGLE